MGLLSFLSKNSTPGLVRLPSGSFTIDSTGRTIASTLPQNFPAQLVRQIGTLVLSTFRSAREANLHVSELTANYASLKLRARELKGGAIVFLFAHGFGSKTTPSKPGS